MANPTGKGGFKKGNKGGGRPKGSKTKKTQEIALKAAEEGITPIEVMLKAMRKHVEADRWDEAASIAKDAAPYIHPKLSSISHGSDPESPLAILGVLYGRISNASSGLPDGEAE